MNRFVLDASVSLRWFLDSNVPAYAHRVKQLLNDGAQAIVPALWQLEMSNGLVVAQRRGVLTAGEVDRSLLNVEQLLEQLIESDSATVSVRQSLTVARQFRLSAYDAAYLATAQRTNLPLATLDERLGTAAKQAGIKLVT